MAEAVVSVALETLGDLLSEEVNLLGNVSTEVRTLQAQLKEIKSLLKDAERKRHDSSTVRGWIGDTRDLAYRAEDAIELYAAVRGRGRGRHSGMLRRCSSILKDGSSLHRISTEISLIKSDIARVTKSMQEYGITRIISEDEGESSADVNQQWRRRTFPFEMEDSFVGKDKELEQLMSLVLDQGGHRVISLWGMGGIGKTTLARKVYNHHNTKRSFESFAWVCISQQCQIRLVLEDVLRQLNVQFRRDGNCSNLSDIELIEQLCEIQKAKKCMIVIDDIWKIGHWEGLRHAFLLQGTLSKILLTTRKQNVADNGYVFKIGLLNENEGWELLKRKSFPHRNIPNHQFEEKLLEKIGKEMVRKCGKLPLAISMLGGILSKKKSTREWELVNENISSYLYRDGGLEHEKDEIHVLGVLDLSYHELPYYLKSCFLYMGRYKEDELINAIDLCWMWIAHGMVSYENEPKDVKLIDIAQQYLSELASRCVVEIVSEDPIRGQTFIFCKLHDVVRELCLSMGKAEEFGLQILDYEIGRFSSLLHERLLRTKTRHLIVNFEREIELESKALTITCDEDSVKLVRSLHLKNCTGKSITDFPQGIIDLKKFKLLKVLVFEGFDFVGKKLPRGIEKLIHLRSLCLQKCKFEELPSSVNNLVYLHTLDLIHSENVRIPNNVLDKMFRLKHLFFPSYNVKEIGSYRLRLEGLDELVTLCGFNSLVHDVKSVIRMKNLLNFDGAIYDNKSLCEIMHAASTSWKNLRYCGLIIRKDCCLTSLEEDLMNFKKLFTSPNLHNLCIYVPIGKVLKELQNQVYASNLVILKLEDCEIEEDPMETLGNLPLLRYLNLIRCYVGGEMTFRAFGFPRLEKLCVASLPNLRELRVEQGSMPLVFEIYIYHCTCLEIVPDGFRFLAALTILWIEGMRELGKRVCDEGGEDFDKVQHVPSILIR